VSTILGLYELERFLATFFKYFPRRISKAISKHLPTYFYELHKNFSRDIKALVPQAFQEPQNIEYLVRSHVLYSNRSVWNEYVQKYIWNPSLDAEVLLMVPKDDFKFFVNQILKFLEKFEEFEFDARFRESFDLLSEHFIVRLNWLTKNPKHYISAIMEFMTHYIDEIYEYAILLISAILVLRILSRRVPLYSIREKDLEKRTFVIEKFVQVVEELDTYTVTFYLLKEPLKEEDLHSIGKADSLEKFRKVLNLE